MKWNSILRARTLRALNLFFPAVCLHCLEQTDFLFCSQCRCHFEPIHPLNRCPFCFKDRCHCGEGKRWRLKKGAVFEKYGAALTFLKHLEKGKFAKTGSAWMAVQLDHLRWTWPEAIIPVLSTWLFRKTEVSYFLAKAMSGTLNIPFYLPWERKKIFNKRILLVSDCLADGLKMEEAAHELAGASPRSLHGLAFCE